MQHSMVISPKMGAFVLCRVLSNYNGKKLFWAISAEKTKEGKDHGNDKSNCVQRDAISTTIFAPMYTQEVDVGGEICLCTSEVTLDA